MEISGIMQSADADSYPPDTQTPTTQTYTYANTLIRSESVGVWVCVYSNTFGVRVFVRLLFAAAVWLIIC